MGVNTALLIGVSDDRRKDTVEALQHSVTAFRQLKAAIEHEIKALDNTPSTDYDSNAWAYKQADRLGQLRAFRRILSFLPQ